VEQVVFGAPEDDDAQMPSVESRRLDSVRPGGKGSGAPAGVWPRHAPSVVDHVVFGSGEATADAVVAAMAEEVRRGKGSGGAYGAWPRHMRSDVDRVVFGHDIDGSEEVEAAEAASPDEARRGKAGGGANGAWPRHMRSDVDRVVFGHDMDGSEEVELSPAERMRLDGVRRGKGSGAPEGTLPRHMRSDVDRLIFGRDIDASEEADRVEKASLAKSRNDLPVTHPPRAVLKPAVAADLAPPSAEDLFALNRLYCGDRASIVHFLAAQRGADPNVMAPSVHSWLDKLPSLDLLPLPSRSRSSPAMHAMPKWRAAVAPPDVSLDRGALAHRHGRDAPAATAPIYGAAVGAASAKASALACALSGLHSASARLHESANPLASSRASAHGGFDLRGGRASAAAAQIYALPHDGAVDFSPMRLSAAAIAAVPEDAPVDYGEDAALKAFMARAQLRGQISPDQQEARRAAATAARSWRMRT